ncbi:MAG: pentapeptide repeat-containing protein, partial [Cyanobacteria bacterium P01_C01_bin.118]
MKKLVLGTLTILVLTTVTAQAENPEHRRQLLQTNSCKNCDLSDANLAGLDLRDANLQGANLSGANLTATQLIRANLKDANLQNTLLLSTDLTGANLQAADLTNAHSTHICQIDNDTSEEVASCMGEWLSSKLGKTLCEPAYGVLGNLPEYESDALCDNQSQARLLFEYLPYTVLINQLFLQGANLQDANLTGANLMGADLRYADLNGAQAIDTEFSYALMIGADTTEMQEADLAQAWITRRQLGTWFVDNYQSPSRRARASEGRTYVGAMNRGQQAYYLENEQFSDSMDRLGLGIANETDNYRYDVVRPAASEQWVMNYGLSRVDGLNSFIGFAYITTDESDELITRATLCQSTTAEIINVSDLPTTYDISSEPV